MKEGQAFGLSKTLATTESSTATITLLTPWLTKLSIAHDVPPKLQSIRLCQIDKGSSTM